MHAIALPSEEITVALKPQFDYAPLWLLPALALIGLLIVRNPSTWVTLTIAGIGMGLIIFLAASGLTLVFGLMGVMNFGHSIFVTLGAIVGGMMFLPTVMPLLSCWCRADSMGLNLLAIAVAAIIAMFVAAIIGLIFERLLVRQSYGKSLSTQIMLTVGGMVITEQLMIMLIGRGMIMKKPPSLTGVLLFGDIAIEKYRLLTMVVGLAVFFGLLFLLKRTKLGLLVRAAVEQREMVEAFGYRVKFLFIGFFVAGAMLAALGGMLYGMYQGQVTLRLGANLMIPILMVLIIGGLGSITGACIASILVGMLSNYVAFAWPSLTAFSTIFLMFAIALWRPYGLYPVHL